MRSRFIACLFLASTLLAPAFAFATEPTTIYVTRHAEKADGGKDPELTSQGKVRARTLALILRKVGIKHVFSTATKRTQQTALPLAAQAGLEVHTYDPSTGRADCR